MTVETVFSVVLTLDAARRTLVADIESAAARARKAAPGDRHDVVRYEALSTQLETWVFQEIWRGAEVRVHRPDHVGAVRAPVPGSADRMLFTVRLPLEGGATPRLSGTGVVAAPAVAWRSPDGAKGRRAVEQRFEAQVRTALECAGGLSPTAISPSGIHNATITEVLRKHVGLDGARVEVPVAYRDGSRARQGFPFRAGRMAAQRPEHNDLELRLALLSIRHAEMDAIVDGAWLRNVEVSMPRAAAETDDYVYATSRDQLDELTDRGRRRVHIELFQTGLEPAVVGFYRAVAEHQIACPGSLAVTPVYFRRHPAQSGTAGEYRYGTGWYA
ncbi:hypothetical protein [Nocardia salmonicida]|uniref:hypothetical protein n=1 Tax=Nocardia salmonicida TaxID=53431 RepID=UPI000B1635D0|nr:hypothetical protein [Nocardia salmonicida]